jgi:dTDP-4-amino-4,6-dideoxygalactose transaminase
LNNLKTLTIRDNTIWNYSYYPVIFETEYILLEVQKILNNKGIFPRRYFFPSLNTIPYINRAEMPISESIASRILCLPLYSGLTNEEVLTIVSIINSNI